MSSIGENVDDRLSRLPEDTLSHILSLITTKFVMRTSILSKRWRYTWMSVNNLDFDDIHPFHSEIVLSKFLDRVMENCKSSQIQSFRLHFPTKWVKRTSVSSWIDKAVRLNV
ncbi:putative F-box domain-containing protein [Helianthus annuus]|nr:putative F-box domain-containing protein [Helianthus annuus]